MRKLQNVTRFRTVPGVFAAFGLMLASAAFGQAQAPVAAAPAPGSGIATSDGDDKITINFVNADIQAVIKTVGQWTGRNFILDPRVTGTVNIVSERPVSRDLLYQIFLSALRVQGYAAVEGEGFTKIVPEAEAKTSAGPVGEQAARIPGDRIVTQVFILQNESAVQLVPVLRPLVTANNFIGAYPNNNAIVITDYATNVRRIGEIIRSIDQPQGGDVQVIRLQNASAIDIAGILQRVVPETVPSPTAPGSPAKAALAVDPRTNSLIVRGENPGLIARIRSLAAGLDTPGAGAGNIFVVPLRNAEATKIAETLRALLSGESASRSTSTTTSFTPSGAPQGTTPATSTSTSTSAGSNNAPPASTIQAYQPTNSLIITAPEPVYRNLRAVIDKLDERRAQVYVEALVVELTLGKAAEFGVQWQGLSNLNNSGRGVIGGTNFSTSPGGFTGTNILGATGALGTLAGLATLGPGLNLGVVSGTISVTQPDGTVVKVANLGLLARAFEGDSNSNVLSTPNILTLDNEEAKLLVGQNVPFITGSYTPTAGSATNPFQTIERKDIGITLRVRPTITEAGTVKLGIFEEVSSVTNDKTLVQSADIITNKRSLETTVLADDGQIVVLGGLIQDDKELNIDKIPLLGDIPYLGALFRYQSRTHRRTNLMIFLRPVVLKDANAARPLTLDRYEYIRNLQNETRQPNDVVLPSEAPTQLPPMQDMQDKDKPLIGK
ncbi:MAG TPA: type II secretion system secretin GspD [Usitatibacter sp.]|nr:type II secretion system secretin GspD [Usitatibacter sp.]